MDHATGWPGARPLSQAGSPLLLDLLKRVYQDKKDHRTHLSISWFGVAWTTGTSALGRNVRPSISLTKRSVYARTPLLQRSEYTEEQASNAPLVFKHPQKGDCRSLPWLPNSIKVEKDDNKLDVCVTSVIICIPESERPIDPSI